jgi:hypothetical protein
LSGRSYEEELMDDLEDSGEVIPQTLRELETINKWLGGRLMYRKMLSTTTLEFSIYRVTVFN